MSARRRSWIRRLAVASAIPILVLSATAGARSEKSRVPVLTLSGDGLRAVAEAGGRTSSPVLGPMVARGKGRSPGKRSPKAPSPTRSTDSSQPDAPRVERERPRDESVDGTDEVRDDGAGDDGERRRDVDADAPRPRRRARITESEEADVAATAEPSGSEAGTRWLELALGARGFSRDLRYNQLVTPGLREYQLALGPAAVLDVALFPFALVSRGPAANIGLVAELEQAVGTSSQLEPDGTFPDGARLPTSMRQLAGGIRYRIPIDAWQVAAAVTGGEHAFWFTNGDGVDRAAVAIPNVNYRFVRGGLDVRVAVTPEFSIAVGGGYRHILNQGGPIQAEFPHLTVAGVDGHVRAAYALTPTIEARVQGEVRRYFYDMHSIAGDQRLAGGAVDQYLSAAFLLALTLDRSP